VTPRTNRVVLALAAAAALMRGLVFAGTDLYADEAYYWLWGQRPGTGYFDHPPMVAWLVRLSSALVPGETGVRLLFLVCGAATVWLTARIAAEVSDRPGAPVVSALLAATAPMMTVTGALALPDAPHLALYALAMWLVLRSTGPEGSSRLWVAAGLAWGLAMLAKYSSALLGPSVLALALLDPATRAGLRTRGPYIGAAAALAVFLPCLAWNVAHDFVSFRFQANHAFAGQQFGKHLPDYLGAVLAGAGPLAVFAALRRFARVRRDATVRLACLALVPLAVTTWSALKRPVEANWPAIVYPALLAAAGAAFAETRRVRIWTGLSVAFGLVVTALYASELRHPRLMAPASPPVERFRGWPAQAAAISTACGGPETTIVPSNYQVASELAYYAGQRRFEATFLRPSQFDLWPAPAPGRRCLVALKAPDASVLAAHGFAPDAPVERLDATFAGEVIRSAWVVRR
jgi:4-amino-4-deoxy-L-arabinose transferase-like glycosyltransferase